MPDDTSNWPPPDPDFADLDKVFAPETGQETPRRSATPGVPVKTFFQTYGNGLLVVAAMLIYVGYDKFSKESNPNPTVAVDGKKLGKIYAHEVLTTFADAWDAAADKLDAGGKVADAQTTLQDSWTKSRAAAFASGIAPEFNRVLTEGTEPTATQLPAVTKLWRDFAAGLKQGAK